MNILELLQNPALKEFMKDQRLRELITRREFRISEEYLYREFVSGAGDEELQELSLTLHDGYGEISGTVKKRLIPMAIPFTARFSVRSVVFSALEKKVHLAMDEVKPLDLDWVTRRVVERVPFLSWEGGRVICDLEKVPRLGELLSRRIGSLRASDFVTLKELSFRPGEIVGRVGVVL
jgi:hypothetical protein